MTVWRSFQRATSIAAATCLFFCAAPSKAADLPTRGAAEPLIAAVRLNGQLMAEPAIFLKDSAGRLYANEKSLRQWRLKVAGTDTVSFEGEIYRCIEGHPLLKSALVEADQAVIIDAPPSLFDRQGIDLGGPDLPPMTNSSVGAFINYDLFVESGSDRNSLNGAVDLNVFTSAGTGRSSFVGRAGGGQRQLLRLDSSWTLDYPDGLTSIRFGDGITRGASGIAPLRFGGIQFARNFAVQPGYVTIPLPTVRGSSALSSVAELYVNNVLQGSHELEPGLFEFQGTPVQTGGGTIQIVTNDILGRQITTAQHYYVSSDMLRQGLHDFSYEVGFLRKNFGISSNQYGRLLASAVHRYGVSDELTGEVSLQLTKSHQTAGASLTASIFDLAMINAGARFSQSPAGHGSAASFSLERRSRGLSFGLRGELRSQEYRVVGELDNRRTKLNLFAFADYSFDRGSVGLNYYRKDLRMGDDEQLVGLFANLGLGGGTLHLWGRKAVSARTNTIFGASFALPLGPRRSAAASVEVEAGRRRTRLSVQQNPQAGAGPRYRASVESGDLDAFQAEYVWQGLQATWGVEVAKTGGSAGVRLSLAGALGLINDNLFVSRRLNSSFAEVQVDGYSGVRVYADNQLVGVTGADGRLIVPNLRAFEPNPIKIEQSDLPLEAQLASFNTIVRPYAGAGVTIRFSPEMTRGVLMRVRLRGGEVLPAGAKVVIEGGQGTYLVATGGELYIEGLSGSMTLRARWLGRSCSFNINVPDNDDPQPQLDGLVCLEERHAAL